LQQGAISFSHPEFHKRETTLMSSRNATREDFEHVIKAMKTGLVDPSVYITQTMKFDELKEAFETWLYDADNVIKAMVTMDE
ncbi:MAG: alcohol dehydrogenase, partial [Ginsengibacter sp.]